MKDLLLQIYENPSHPAGLSNPKKLYDAVKRNNISFRVVNSFLETQDSYTKHKAPKYQYKRRPVTSPTINFRFQADLMVMDKIYRQNSFYKYILVVIDVLSRFAWAFPLKTKKASEVAEAFDKLFSKVKPKYVQNDFGTEFYGQDVQRIFKKHGVEMYSTYSNVKASVVERFIRTLRQKINHFMVHNQTKRYIDHLQTIIDSYNHTKHSRTKLIPAETTLDNQMEAWHNSFDKQLSRKRIIKFKLNDYVRILVKKKLFTKGRAQTFSNTIYQVAEIVNSNPVTYKLKDSQGIVMGSFYNEELCKVSI